MEPLVGWSGFFDRAPNPEQVSRFLTCSGRQKMWASSCWNRRTRVSPVRAPDSSFRCKTPKSAIRRGSSLQDRFRWSKIRQWPGQFMGLRPNCSFSTSKRNMFSA